MDNLFQKESSDRLILNTMHIAHPSAAEMVVSNHYDKGWEHFLHILKDI